MLVEREIEAEQSGLHQTFAFPAFSFKATHPAVLLRIAFLNGLLKFSGRRESIFYRKYELNKAE